MSKPNVGWVCFQNAGQSSCMKDSIGKDVEMTFLQKISTIQPAL